MITFILKAELTAELQRLFGDHQAHLAEMLF
jgi:hypothetical protein